MPGCAREHDSQRRGGANEGGNGDGGGGGDEEGSGEGGVGVDIVRWWK